MAHFYLSFSDGICRLSYIGNRCVSRTLEEAKEDARMSVEAVNTPCNILDENLKVVGHDWPRHRDLVRYDGVPLTPRGPWG